MFRIIVLAHSVFSAFSVEQAAEVESVLTYPMWPDMQKLQERYRQAERLRRATSSHIGNIDEYLTNSFPVDA